MVLLGLGLLLQLEVKETVKNIRLHPDALQKINDSYEHLSKIDALFPIGQTNDAGVLLNPYIRLDSEASIAQKTTWWNAMSKEDMDFVKRHWLTAPETISFPEDNVLEELMDYDFWDLTSSGLYAEQLTQQPTMELTSYPIPYFANLQILAKVRLAKGLEDGSILSALREVRHLARLCQGQEHLVQSLVGIALLSFERVAYLEAVKREILQREQWVPITEADTTLAKNLSFASVGIFLSHDQGEAARANQALKHRIFNQCSTLFEAGVIIQLRHSLKNRWPLEVDLFPMVSEYEQYWLDSGCELPTLELYWDDPTSDLFYIKDGLTVPYIRTLYMFQVLKDWMFVPNAKEPNPY